jgi:hypothetical protein
MGKGDHLRIRERDSRKLQIIRQHASSVSRAIWPTNIRQSYAVGKLAQRKKSSPFIKTSKHLREYFAYMCFRLLSVFSWLSFTFVDHNLHSIKSYKKRQTRDVATLTSRSTPHARSVSKRSPSLPETPMPSEPLIRVLETFDLSHSNIEHFLNGDESRPATTHTDHKKVIARHP